MDHLARERGPGADGAGGVFQRVLDALPGEAGDLAAGGEPIARRGEVGDVVRDGVAASRHLGEREVGAREQHADVASEHGRGHAAIQRHAVDVRQERRRRALVLVERRALGRPQRPRHGQALVGQPLQRRQLQPHARAGVGTM